MMRTSAWRSFPAALRAAAVAVPLACAPGAVLALEPTESKLTFEGSGLFAKFPEKVGESNHRSELCRWGVWPGEGHWAILLHCRLLGTVWYRDQAYALEPLVGSAIYTDADTLKWGEAFELGGAKGRLRARLMTANGDHCVGFVTAWGRGEGGKNTILTGSLCAVSAATDLEAALKRELGFVRLEGAFENLIPPP